MTTLIPVFPTLSGAAATCDYLTDRTEEIHAYSELEDLNSHLAARFRWEVEASPLRMPPLDPERKIERALDSLTGLGDDWDGEGSAGYEAETIQRARLFLEIHHQQLWKQFGLTMPQPTVGPGPDGSVDLLWKRPQGELLISIAAGPAGTATYSGADSLGQRAKGSFFPGTLNRSILACLLTILGR